MCHLGGRRYRKRNSQKDKWKEKEGEEKREKTVPQVAVRESRVRDR